MCTYLTIAHFRSKYLYFQLAFVLVKCRHGMFNITDLIYDDFAPMANRNYPIEPTDKVCIALTVDSMLVRFLL